MGDRLGQQVGNYRLEKLLGGLTLPPPPVTVALSLLVL